MISRSPSAGLVRKSLSRLYLTIALLIFSTIVGMSGFYFIEDYTILESFYMTVITISTVGFEEVRPLSSEGMVFAGLYIIFNLVILAYVVSSITAYLFEGELNKVFRLYMDSREIKKLKDHVIVCGFGRNGRKTAEELISHNTQFIVIEQDHDVYESVNQTSSGVSILRGDATDDDVLKFARVEEASTLITTLPYDADNVFITLTAKELNPDITIIARASEDHSVRKLHRSGAKHVVMPDNIGGLHMAWLITKPYVIEFLDMLNGLDTAIRLEEFDYESFRPEFRDKMIRDLGVRDKSGANIIAYKEKGQNFVFNPSPDVTISPNDVFILLGEERHLAAFRGMYID